MFFHVLSHCFSSIKTELSIKITAVNDDEWLSGGYILCKRKLLLKLKRSEAKPTKFIFWPFSISCSETFSLKTVQYTKYLHALYAVRSEIFITVSPQTVISNEKAKIRVFSVDLLILYIHRMDRSCLSLMNSNIRRSRPARHCSQHCEMSMNFGKLVETEYG